MGLNLSKPAQLNSKKISKTNLVAEIVACNPAIETKVDHEVVIKYVPSTGDDKRAMDEYVAEIFMDGRLNISTYMVCQDSLLAAPIILDLLVLGDWMDRICFREEHSNNWNQITNCLEPIIILL